ncbi:MAG TPA: long-chain fatty acid--CoA ligase [Terriglobales bacterium]|jgi:long-chain acyl-CoA synthetase|nr:long-chain fatty acid--CoA ligase [Terriglobales bacterium]
MSLHTLNDILLAVCKKRRDRVMLQRRALGWVPISSTEIYRGVVGVARALESWGVGKGDRVAILSENRPEWTITDFAALSLGAVTVPVYSTQTAEQTAFLLNDCGARVIAVSTKHQLEKVLTIQRHTPVERIMVMDAVETAHAVQMQGLMLRGPADFDPEFDVRARSIGPDDLATIIYTSGTTGTAKGAMLTHRNMASNIASSMEGFGFGTKEEVSVSFLPLSHVTARHVDFALLYRGVVLAYCPDIAQLAQALTEVQPNIFVAVPRVYEKIRQQVILKATGFPRSAIYRWALSVGRAHRAKTLAGTQPSALSWKMKIANRLVFSRVRAGMGGKAEEFISGGAPLGRELAEWYADIGISIHEGYGLTETSPVIAVNTPGEHKLGTVGKPLANVEVRLADDGEVLVRGPSIFRGYWNRPEETRNAFVDGWFKTGDIGQLDSEGYLSITDRKKDLIKTSGGKFIAPQPIENSLKLNPLIGTAVVIGDRRKFPAVLISPHFPVLEDWARANQVEIISRETLVANVKVQALYDGIIEELNQNLARFERLKRVLIVAEEFSAADGTLTHTLKVRRRGIEDRYRALIDEMYRKAERAGG